MAQAGRKSGKPALQKNHIQALDLIRAGGMNHKQVAEAVGFTENHLNQLIAGEDSCGVVGKLFHAEIKKFYKEMDARIDEGLKKNRELAVDLMERYLTLMKKNPKPTDKERRLIASYMTALGALAPKTPRSVGISYHFTTFSTQELLYEYDRLRGLAEGTPFGRGVQESKPGEPGTLPESTESGNNPDEEPEDSGV